MAAPVYALNLFDVEWASKAAFDSYCTRAYIWHPFDKLDDLRPILKG